ncbi:MAG: GtrA family protein [Oscillospiraceae bacterium]|nr:GtrA family protein [Oscillospiraceae bacterium]
MKKLFNWCVNFIRTLDWAEVFRYFVVGVCTTVLNIFIFWLLGKKLGLNEHVSNIVAWILSTLFAFVTNCFIVFRIKPKNIGELFRFMLSFYGERIFTLGVEELLILIFITLLHLPRMPVKFVTTCITIALNYLLSKFVVFHVKEEKSDDADAEDDGKTVL